MYQRIDNRGAKPATAADGAPTAEELIAAYDVPAHRHAAVAEALAEVLKERRRRKRPIDAGVFDGIHVSSSREAGRAMKDRLRTVSGNGGIAGLIDGGRGGLVLREAGVRGALAMGAMLMTAPAGHQALDRLDTLAYRWLGQHIIDSCSTGDDDKDQARDAAHTYAMQIDVLMRHGAIDAEDMETLAAFESMCAVASINHLSAARLMMGIVDLVERDGPWVDAGGAGDVVERIMQQIEMTEILDRLVVDSTVLAAINQRREDQRAWRAAKRLAAREAAARIEPPPLLPLPDPA